MPQAGSSLKSYSTPQCWASLTYTLKWDVRSSPMWTISTIRSSLQRAQHCLDHMSVECCRTRLKISAAKLKAMALRRLCYVYMSKLCFPIPRNMGQPEPHSKRRSSTWLTKLRQDCNESNDWRHRSRAFYVPTYCPSHSALYVCFPDHCQAKTHRTWNNPVWSY